MIEVMTSLLGGGGGRRLGVEDPASWSLAAAKGRTELGRRRHSPRGPRVSVSSVAEEPKHRVH